MPQLEHLGYPGQVWVQQDGAQAYYAITVREFLSKCSETSG